MGLGMGGGAGLRPMGVSSGLGGIGAAGLSMTPSAAQVSGGKAANQSFDPSLQKLFGDAFYTSDDGTLYYRGGEDYSEATLGSGDLTLRDTGPAVYDMLRDDGSVLGTYYGSITDAINKNARAKFVPGPITEGEGWTEWGPTGSKVYSIGGDEWSQPQSFSTYEDALNAMMAQQGVGNYSPRGYWDTAGKLEDWEVLGQVLNGDLSYAGGFNKKHRYMPGNNTTEYISGHNQMYDSQPLIYDDKLLGYLMDLGPNDRSQGHLAGYQNDFHISRVDSKGNTRSNYQLYRDIGDPAEWQKHGYFLDEGGKYFIKPEEVENLPGWKQGDAAQYSHKSSGLGGKILGGLGAILSFTPLAPFGYALSALSAAMNNNPLGMFTSIFGGALGSATDFLSSGLTNLGVPGQLSPYLTEMAMGTGANLLQGQDLDDALAGGALGTAANLLGGAFGGALADAGAGAMSGTLGGAAAGALTGAVRGGGAGAARGAISGALRGSKRKTQQKEVA